MMYGRGVVLVWLLTGILVLPPRSFSAQGARSGATAPAAAPEAIYPPKTTDSFKCERQFTYQGKTLDCDSKVRQDAEGLRPIILDVPSAVSELDTYQRNRQSVRAAAYVGTAGLLVVLTSVILASRHTYPDGSLDPTGVRNRAIGAGVGLGISTLSLVYGLSMLRGNQAHLDSAVQNFNAVHPERPIELQFSTGIMF